MAVGESGSLELKFCLTVQALFSMVPFKYLHINRPAAHNNTFHSSIGHYLFSRAYRTGIKTGRNGQKTLPSEERWKPFWLPRCNQSLLLERASDRNSFNMAFNDYVSCMQTNIIFCSLFRREKCSWSRWWLHAELRLHRWWVPSLVKFCVVMRQKAIKLCG